MNQRLSCQPLFEAALQAVGEKHFTVYLVDSQETETFQTPQFHSGRDKLMNILNTLHCAMCFRCDTESRPMFR